MSTVVSCVSDVLWLFLCSRSRVLDGSVGSVSVVADLRSASLSVMRRVAEILLLLQQNVHTFYAVQPKKRDGQKLLQKLLSSSKRSPPVNIQRWYHAAVCENFLQDLLWTICLNQYDQEEPPLLPHQPTEIFSVIRAFLRLQPPPEVDELMHLAHLTNVVPDEMKKAGKQLVKRLLISPGSTRLQELRLALQWQYEYLKGRSADSSSDHPSVFRDSDIPVNTDVMTRHNGVKYPPILQPGTKLSSLSSFDSGFEGVGSGHLETGSGKTSHIEAYTPKSPLLLINEENVSSISEGSEKFLHIIPNAGGDSVNFEITVKRSAMLPKNPWLSLPVDDLESFYTVIISPIWQKDTQRCDQLTQTTDSSVCNLLDQSSEWSPITNVLSSTITDEGPGAERSETMPTLLWDSYDLHKSDSMSLCGPDSEWEQKEQQELQAVEQMLNRTAGILQEEESVLAQEEILEVLLEAESAYGMCPSWSKACEFSQITSSDVGEAGVIRLEDDFTSSPFGYRDVLSQESPAVPQTGRDAPSEPGNGGSDKSALLKEMDNLNVLEDQIVEQKLKVKELHCCESNERMSIPSLCEDRKRIFKKLEGEKVQVEEMKRNLSRDMKSKLKGSSRSHKIVRCSVLGKGLVLKEDEELLMNCRSSAQEAPEFIQGQNHV
ncbi:hypothetical protein Baya_16820 [Bagarius yarrelli]|uniref:Uncharacterized protein n=1 Tax=Bagarius yarrelli TaxID=175774 RepID=A0A556VWK7_BAGYA|nr:hypothetical protein Baya_16820 [Bagarius yarrelli]